MCQHLLVSIRCFFFGFYFISFLLLSFSFSFIIVSALFVADVCRPRIKISYYFRFNKLCTDYSILCPCAFFQKLKTLLVCRCHPFPFERSLIKTQTNMCYFLYSFSSTKIQTSHPCVWASRSVTTGTPNRPNIYTSANRNENRIECVCSDRIGRIGRVQLKVCSKAKNSQNQIKQTEKKESSFFLFEFGNLSFYLLLRWAAAAAAVCIGQ